jgi:TATA element modulatory factor
MWGSFLDKGRELAEKAAQAAAELDKQLNDSVGVAGTTSTTQADSSIIQSSLTTSFFGTTTGNSQDEIDEDDVLNDEDWGEDDDNLNFDQSIDDQQLPVTTSPHEEIPLVEREDEEVENVEDSKNMDVSDNLSEQIFVEGDDNDEKIAQKILDIDLQQNLTETGDSSFPDDVDRDSQNRKDATTDEVDKPELQSVDPTIDDTTQETPAVDDQQENRAIIDNPIESVGDANCKDDDDEFTSAVDNVIVNVSEVTALEFSDLDANDNTIGIDRSDEPAPQETSVYQDMDVSKSNSHLESEEVTEDDNCIDNNKTIEDLVQHDVVEHQVIASTTSDNLSEFMRQQSALTATLENRIEELMTQLEHREMQLVQKSEELIDIQGSFEKERNDFQHKLQSTKEEAKRRLAKAKERVDAVERQIQNVTVVQSGTAEAIAQKDEIIAALRSEGQKLAHKQAEMEKATRTAKAEAREVRTALEETAQLKEDALARIEELSAELEETKEALASARQGESQADKLESELRQVRDESERRQATIISMEQHNKDLKAEIKGLQEELEASRKGAAEESVQERKKLLKEQSELAKDLENTIRVTEREAALREDALRHEIEEIRKRWQDAVRRADTLAIDIQSSTAPLLRQLDSVSKQNRTRASAWAELETQLRSELEENVVTNEKLSKERNEWKSKFTRTERLYIDQEEAVKQMKKDLEEKSTRVTLLENQISKMNTESASLKEQWAEVEKVANEGVSKVRTDMMKTVVENEERYRSQLDLIKSELNTERANRKELEQQVSALLCSAQVLSPQDSPAPTMLVVEETKPRKLLKTEGQASILANTLEGLVDDSDDEHDDADATVNPNAPSNNFGSFAALDQLTSSLKATKNELLVLRNRLADSEKSREELNDALAECRSAKEKLPLFESKVKELTAENNELLQQVNSLREDIAEVKELYRAQLNVLLEEKVIWETNGPHDSPACIEDDQQTLAVHENGDH